MKYRICILFLLGSVLACTESGKRGHTTSQGGRSGERRAERETESRDEEENEPRERRGKTVVKMEKKQGVYQVPVEVNGVKMYFIFDTGAGMVSISATEAGFLYKQGSLTDEDFKGSANFIDANGNVSEGTIINLKTIKVGNRTLRNVQASVVHNTRAPLLLGQSVFEQFGVISIDNDKGTITFE
jgi:aspartyl protease family protein